MITQTQFIWFVIAICALSYFFLVGATSALANSAIQNQRCPPPPTCPTCPVAQCPPCPVCPTPIIQAPPPTVVTPAPAPVASTPPPVQVATSPLLLQSPSTDADLETILNYLLKRGGRLDGSAWSSEAQTALQNKTVWTGGSGQGSTRTFIYPQGVNTQRSWQIFYDDASGRWNMRSTN